MADDHSGKKGKIELVTDPDEIRKILDNEQAHERSLQESQRRSRELKAMARATGASQSGHKLNAKWTKIEDTQDASSSILGGHVMRSRDIEGEHFTLSVHVDYAKIHALHKGPAKSLPVSLEFNQHRATSFSASTFDSLAEAQAELQRIDQYLMHVLAETGAENTKLAIENGQVVIFECEDESAAQSYSDALRTARLVETFRTNLHDASEPNYRQLIGTILTHILEETGLTHERLENDQDGVASVKLVFENDIGIFDFTQAKRDYLQAQMTHTVKRPQTERTIFDGPLSRDTLQSHFIDWIAAAAREQDLIDDTLFDKLSGQLSEIKGIPLTESKLGLLSPFGTEDSFARPNFKAN